MIAVTAAVIQQDGRVLICQRREGQKHPLKWEFPGGKVEPGEEPAAALVRELQEELGIRAVAPIEITRFPYQYPGGSPLLLIFYRVEEFSRPVQNLEFADLRWVQPKDLLSFDFLEADIEFVRALARGENVPLINWPTMVDCVGVTDVGLSRPANEDAYALEPGLGLFIVADGMGGAQAGERASAITVETVVDLIRKAAPPRTSESLVEAIRAANRNVLDQAAAFPEYEGMGTTVVAALLEPPLGHIASVGDSRLYLFRAGQLHRVTSDQTWVNEVGRRLGLTEEQMHTHPFRNVLTMAVGAREEIDVHQHEVDLESGDVLLLCSDGLHGVIGEISVAEVLGGSGSLQEQGAELIHRAREAGGPDNITAVLVRVP